MDTKRRGPKPKPDALRFQSIGLRPDQRQWLRLWRLNPDNPPAEAGSADDNPTEQLQLMLDTVMKFFPEGSDFRAWPRDDKGRFRTKD